MIELIVIIAIIAVVLVTLYGAALIISEHFWIGLLLLLFLSPVFFIWAFIKGIIGKNNDTINH